MTEKKIPTPDEIQTEFEKFVKERFGGVVQVFAQKVETHPPFPMEENFHPPLKNKEDKFSDQRKKAFSFNLRPSEIKSYLDRFVIQQDEAKKVLSIAVCDHYNQIRAEQENPQEKDKNYQKQNLIVLGSTGVGKTYLVRLIAKLIGVPFVKADATRFTETGYVGASVDDLIRDLLQQANQDKSLAQYGIIYIDEIDKIAGHDTRSGKDISGRGVQFELLKLMEETDVDLRASGTMASQMQAFMEFQQKGKLEPKLINTKHILFIMSGAFTGLEEIIKTRMNQHSIGLHQNKEYVFHPDKLLNQATTKDFIDFGFEPEFIGRIPVRVSCQTLSAHDLKKVLLNSEDSILKQYEKSFQNFGVTLTWDDEAIDILSERAASENTGARGLMSVCEKIFRDYKFYLPEYETIKNLHVTKEMILEPEKYLKKIIKKHSIDSFS